MNFLRDPSPEACSVRKVGEKEGQAEAEAMLRLAGRPGAIILAINQSTITRLWIVPGHVGVRRVSGGQ